MFNRWFWRNVKELSWATWLSAYNHYADSLRFADTDPPLEEVRADFDEWWGDTAIGKRLAK